MSTNFSYSRSKPLEQLSDIQLELAATISRDQVLQRIAAATAKLAQCESGAVLVYDETIKQLRFAAATRHADKLVNLPVPIDGSISGAAFASGEAILVKDVEKDERYFRGPEMATGEKIHALLAVPLQYKKRKLGVLVAERKVAGREFLPEDLVILNRLAAHATIAIDNATLFTTLQKELEKYRRLEKEMHKQQAQAKALSQERLQELTEAQAEVKRMNRLLQESEQAREKLAQDLHYQSTNDPLTGAFNRHQFFTMADQAFRQGLRYGTALSVALLDVDHFKRINDEFGHETGDQALKRLAGFLSANLRDADVLGRLEGEEFALLMPETALEMASQAANRLIEGVRLLAMGSSSQPIYITLSVGVAELNHLKDQTIDTLIERAEQALLQAKLGGRDRVTTSVVKE